MSDTAVTPPENIKVLQRTNQSYLDGHYFELVYRRVVDDWRKAGDTDGAIFHAFSYLHAANWSGRNVRELPADATPAEKAAVAEATPLDVVRAQRRMEDAIRSGGDSTTGTTDRQPPPMHAAAMLLDPRKHALRQTALAEAALLLGVQQTAAVNQAPEQLEGPAHAEDEGSNDAPQPDSDSEMGASTALSGGSVDSRGAGPDDDVGMASEAAMSTNASAEELWSAAVGGLVDLHTHC
jgi:hypothetical protein